MTSVDRIDGAVGERVEVGRPPMPYQLTEQELDAAVAAQLEQRVEQGFGEVAPIVLSRIAQIVATVGSGAGTSVTTPCSDDHTVLGRVA